MNSVESSEDHAGEDAKESLTGEAGEAGKGADSPGVDGLGHKKLVIVSCLADCRRF